MFSRLLKTQLRSIIPFFIQALLKLMEASAELQSKIEKTDNVEEAVFGEGEYVTSRSKGTVYGKDGSVLFNRKYVMHGPTKANPLRGVSLYTLFYLLIISIMSINLRTISN